MGRGVGRRGAARPGLLRACLRGRLGRAPRGRACKSGALHLEFARIRTRRCASLVCRR